MKSYKDLEIYRNSVSLAKEVHFMSLKLPKYELYELGSQTRRSAQSIRSNIAEGYGRRNYKSDFHKFLIYSYASLIETESHLEMIFELYQLEECSGILEKYHALGKQLSKFISFVDSSWKTD